MKNTTNDMKNALNGIANSYVTLCRGWLEYGSTMIDIRAEHEDDEAFFATVKELGLDRVYDAEISREAIVASMWAYKNQQQAEAVEIVWSDLEVGISYGYRDIHAKWLEYNPHDDDEI